MIRCLAILAALGLATPPQDPPKARINIIWTETAIDVWDELRQVDPAFKLLPEEVARLAQGLEADDIEQRAKAAASLMDLGLTAYEPIKALRDQSTSTAMQSELTSILKAMAGSVDPPPARLPGARRVGEKEGRDLRSRLKEKKLIHQNPLLVLFDGQRGSVQVGDAHPVVAKRRSFTIEGNGKAVRQDENVSLMEVGWFLEITPKVDGAKGTVTLDVTATVRGKVGMVPSESIVASSPEDAGPFFDPGNDKPYRHPQFYKVPRGMKSE